jgi:putative FmdB family regulatory protein
MPIYEYTCTKCARLTSNFVRSAANEKPPQCQHCGGTTTRALSRFAVGRSASSIKQDFGTPPRSMEDYSDPRQIGRWVEQKFDEYGMDVPDQAREMIDAARDGELPDAVKDL